MKRAFFTINFGTYDSLKPPTVITPGWDYYVFTDKDINLPPYKTVKVDTGLPVHLQARDCYINSQKYLPDYDLTFMVGGQVQVKCNLDKFIEKYCDLTKDVNLFSHPCRTCIYKEAEIIIRENIDKAETVNKQMNKYRSEGMPENFGLFAHGVIIRKKSDKVKRHEELWFNEVKNHSHRDQLSFTYILWKYNLITTHTFPYNLLWSEWFSVFQHVTNKQL